MDLAKDIDKINKQDKNIYLELDGERYYAFEPQKEYFGLLSNYDKAKKHFYNLEDGAISIFENYKKLVATNSYNTVKECIIQDFEKYYKLRGCTRFYEVARNVFLIEDHGENDLLLLDLIPNQTFTIGDELTKLRQVISSYKNIDVAYCFVHSFDVWDLGFYRNDFDKHSGSFNEGDTLCYVFGYAGLENALNFELKNKIRDMRKNYYYINEELKIQDRKCEWPQIVFYKNGNLMYYGDVKINKAEEHVRYSLEHHLCNAEDFFLNHTMCPYGNGILLDEDGSIVQVNNFKGCEFNSVHFYP